MVTIPHDLKAALKANTSLSTQGAEGTESPVEMVQWQQFIPQADPRGLIQQGLGAARQHFSGGAPGGPGGAVTCDPQQLQTLQQQDIEIRKHMRIEDSQNDQARQLLRA